MLKLAISPISLAALKSIKSIMNEKVYFTQGHRGLGPGRCLMIFYMIDKNMKLMNQSLCSKYSSYKDFFIIYICCSTLPTTK